VHRDQVDVGSVLIVSASVVVDRSDLSHFRWLSTDSRSTCSVFVNVISQVNYIVGVLVYYGPRIGREEAATLLALVEIEEVGSYLG